jgi:hypothetical protein
MSTVLPTTHWFVMDVGHGDAVAPAVAEPHIVSTVRQHVRQSFVAVVQADSCSTVLEAVLEEDHSFAGGAVQALRDALQHILR